MSPQTLLKEDCFFSKSTISVNDEWKTIHSQKELPLGSQPEGTEISNIPLVFPHPVSRKTRIKETEVEWWLGRITEIGEDVFSGLLEDLSGRVNVVEFSKDIVSQDEQALLCEGAIFTYSISAIDNPNSRSGGREYKTKLAISGKKRWLSAYSEKVKGLAESIFPESLLD